jgi:hypothetical protein
MTYALVFDLPGPSELYRAAHAEFAKFPADEMVLHVARPTGDGVQVVEVWTSAEAFQEWMSVAAGPVFGALAAAGWSMPEVRPTSFGPAGLIVRSAGIAI